MYVIRYKFPNGDYVYWTGRKWVPLELAAKRYKRYPLKNAIRKATRYLSAEQDQRRIQVVPAGGRDFA